MRRFPSSPGSSSFFFFPPSPFPPPFFLFVIHPSLFGSFPPCTPELNIVLSRTPRQTRLTCPTKTIPSCGTEGCALFRIFGADRSLFPTQALAPSTSDISSLTLPFRGVFSLRAGTPRPLGDVRPLPFLLWRNRIPYRYPRGNLFSRYAGAGTTPQKTTPPCH